MVYGGVTALECCHVLPPCFHAVVLRFSRRGARNVLLTFVCPKRNRGSTRSLNKQSPTPINTRALWVTIAVIVVAHPIAAAAKRDTGRRLVAINNVQVFSIL